jgi:hypothetical protein
MYYPITVSMVDQQSALINSSDFIAHVEGNITNFTSGKYIFTPTKNDTSVIVKYHELVVANTSLSYNPVAQNIAAAKVVKVSFTNCNDSVNITFNGSS